jgi:hypothetical protein
VLLGVLVGRRGVRSLGADVRRLVHEGAGQRDDRVRHRRGEQHRLTVGGGLLQDSLDVGQEAQVEHLVGFVEHQHRQAAELQVALLGEVEEPAGRADDDVDAPLQCLDLRLIGTATVNGGDRQLAVTDLEVFRRGGEVVVDLQAELAGGHDDQGAGDPGERPRLVGDETVQQRHAEREGLAHAGAGLADEIVAGQRQRQGQLLDGEGVLDATLGQCAHDLVADAELGEGGGLRGCFGCFDDNVYVGGQGIRVRGVGEFSHALPT